MLESGQAEPKMKGSEIPIPPFIVGDFPRSGIRARAWHDL
jgi:hypothetical protein